MVWAPASFSATTVLGGAIAGVYSYPLVKMGFASVTTRTASLFGAVFMGTYWGVVTLARLYTKIDNLPLDDEAAASAENRKNNEKMANRIMDVSAIAGSVLGYLAAKTLTKVTHKTALSLAIPSFILTSYAMIGLNASLNGKLRPRVPPRFLK